MRWGVVGWGGAGRTGQTRSQDGGKDMGLEVVQQWGGREDAAPPGCLNETRLALQNLGTRAILTRGKIGAGEQGTWEVTTAACFLDYRRHEVGGPRPGGAVGPDSVTRAAGGVTRACSA